MSIKAKLIVWALLFGAAFGAGFMLAYSQVVDLRAELSRTEETLTAARGDIENLEEELQLAELRNLADLMYLETTKHNYELAAGYSTRFFNAVAKAADSFPPPLGTSLEELLERRDMITGVLAKADPVALAEVQALVTRIHETTGPTQ